jgi:hypothetical protein
MRGDAENVGTDIWARPANCAETLKASGTITSWMAITSWMMAGSGKSQRNCQLFENSLKLYTRQMDKSHHIFENVQNMEENMQQNEGKCKYAEVISWHILHILHIAICRISRIWTLQY